MLLARDLFQTGVYLHLFVLSHFGSITSRSLALVTFAFEVWHQACAQAKMAQKRMAEMAELFWDSGDEKAKPCPAKRRRQQRDVGTLLKINGTSVLPSEESSFSEIYALPGERDS